MTWAFLMSSVQMTRAVIEGETSLGGSESSLLGLARGLAARKHEVTIFTTRLGEGEDVSRSGYIDSGGVTWQRLEDFGQMNRMIEWDVVCSQRQMAPFGGTVNARMRLLWTQDLLVPGDMQNQAMAVSWNLDHICYVSDYHRAQWEDLQPELKGLGWVTKNGFDPALVPATSKKYGNRIIHISRPERGLGPLLDMWPRLKRMAPEATLRLCRYSSMYDQGPGSWSDVCASWDARVEAVNAEHGGITYLGELNKADLYKELAEAAVLWYPGVDTFAETGCIAAIEAQACGTPVVASYRGVCPDIVAFGTCIKGSTHDEAYQEASVKAVAHFLGMGPSRASYEMGRQAGRTRVAPHTYAQIAEDWETQVTTWFDARYKANRLGVMRQLLYEDDHVAAKEVAIPLAFTTPEATDAVKLCDRVIDGKDHTAEQYGEAAIADPLAEVESPRFKEVIPLFKDCTQVLDAACGNGSFAIALTLANPKIQVTGLDYAQANVDRAEKAAIEAGVAGRCTFECIPVYDYDAHALHADFDYWMRECGNEDIVYDGLFVGEFVEHVQNTVVLVDGLESVLSEDSPVVYTCPHGACVELLPARMPHNRGHVHRFHYDDIQQVWGLKPNLNARVLDAGDTIRGVPFGNWLISYTTALDAPARPRDLQHRIRKTRPLQRLSVAMIAKDAAANVRRCIDSLYGMADEILVGIDPTTTDETKMLVEAYGRTVRAVEMDSPLLHEDGFAGARNQVLKQCRGEWVLWIDTDEVLMHPSRLRRYLEGSVFNGYVLRQTHLYLDGAPTYDIPVRVFRHDGRTQFYGCIHEQPQVDHANGPIEPTLEVVDVRIAHFGYLEEGQREYKRVTRNLPLLKKDQERFGDRLLGKVLLLREAVIQADAELRRNGGTMTPRIQAGYQHAVALMIEHFDDPAHMYHHLARPWYESALQHLGMGWEQEVAMAGEEGGMGGKHAKPERIWVRDGEEFERILVYKASTLAKKMQPPTFVTNPDDLLPKEDARELVAQ